MVFGKVFFSFSLWKFYFGILVIFIELHSLIMGFTPIFQRCYDEALSNSSYDPLSREDRIHSTLLILNELFRIGNGEAERIRIRSMGFQPVENIRTVVGSNAIDWLTEKTYLAPVDSCTARTLITDHFKQVDYLIFLLTLFKGSCYKDFLLLYAFNC